jgi:alpha-tubulin suppressor-like RCC1 family protein
MVGSTLGVYRFGLIFVSARRNKRHNHHLKGSKIVTVATWGYHTMAVGENGSLWAWGWGSYCQLGLGDTNSRLVLMLVGAEEVFGGSKVRMVACRYEHTLVVTEADEL